MCSRGVYQLKRILFQYCDYGGSSKGARNFIQSESFKKFIENNPQIQFDIIMKRNAHPYISSTYVNGFKKEFPLLNKDPEDIQESLNILRQTFGRQPFPASNKRIFGSKKSIQGEWKQNMWDNLPQVYLEKQRFPETPDLQYELVDKETGVKTQVKRKDFVSYMMKYKVPKRKELEIVPRLPI